MWRNHDWCIKCGARGPAVKEDDFTRDKYVIGQWNRRVFDVIEKAGLEIVKKQDAVQSGDSRNENSWISRWDASFPYQNWYAFHDDDIVDVMNNNGEMRTSRAGDLWWGYEHEMGGIADGVIVKARYSKRPIEERSDTATAGNADVSLTQKGTSYD